MLFFNILILCCSLLPIEVADVYHTGKISPTCKTACMKDNKLFIWRKKSSRVGNYRKNKSKNLTCFAELLLYLTICYIRNLYCQSLEFKGVFYLQFVNFLSNIQIKTPDEKQENSPSNNLLERRFMILLTA